MNSEVERAREKWLVADKGASDLANELFQPGSGYGDPEGHRNDEHRLLTARHEADRLFREYQDIDRRDLDKKMLELQRSQRLATWASFAIAFVVGFATVAEIVMVLLI